MTVESGGIESQLPGRLQFETLLADLSSRFVNLEPTAVDGEIDHALRRICECLDLDLAALFQWSDRDRISLVMTHLYRPLGGPPVPETMDARQYFPWSLEQALGGRVFSFVEIDQTPPEAARDREVWDHFGLKSGLVIPLASGGRPIDGVLGFHTMRTTRSWPDEIVQRLQLVAQVFANALARKLSDTALRESEERLELAASAAAIGMWVFDQESDRFWATNRAREIFGFEADTDITMGLVLQSVHPQHRDQISESVRNAIENRTEIDIEYRIVLADRSVRWVHSRGRLQPAKAGGSPHLLGATVDITDRKRSEEALRRSLAEVEQLKSKLEIENTYLKRAHRLHHGSGRIVGDSSAITQCLGLAEQVAPTHSTVLVEGETGTGKELIARHIHELSPRRERPMIKVNCAALPSTLVESELFGHEKGAYTGAVSRQAGRFEVADGSTLFLDEIAELPIDLQSKLLRVLEESRFERVGSSRTLTTDVRVIAATNRDLRAEVEAGRFRRDLYFRLAVFPILVPPLRERREDIPSIVWSMVAELGAAMNKSVESISSRDMESLQRYDWPGNVRELRNLVERALILCTGPRLRIAPPIGTTLDGEAIATLDEAQRRQIVKAIDAAGGRISGAGGAADLLGLKPTTLRSKMKRLGLDAARLRRDTRPVEGSPEPHR